MRTLKSIGFFLLLSIFLSACKPSSPKATSPTNSETISDDVQREQLFQRFLVELKQAEARAGVYTNESATNQNFEPLMRQLFDLVVVHPSFGLRWDEVPPPTITGAEALAGVTAFISSNGWNMETNPHAVIGETTQLKPIHNLPWKVIKNREFRAVTHNNVLYVIFCQGHHDWSGVAYNPNTNLFAPNIIGFKPIGEHWYVWGQPEFYTHKLGEKYEGPTK